MNSKAKMTEQKRELEMVGRPEGVSCMIPMHFLLVSKSCGSLILRMYTNDVRRACA